ncbi:MAG TPA: HlyD family efflux transporter periplasmic adaptor subunit [Rhodanobacteraceae bacterium]
MIKGSLFRQEAVQTQRGQWLGTIHLATPLAFRWLALLGAVLALTIVLFMLLGHYTQREQVTGQLVPSAGVLGMHSPISGTVTKVFVHEGQVVQAGQPLVEISGDHDSASLGATQALIGRQLDAQAKRLQSQLANQRQSARAQAAQWHTKLELLQQQVVQIDGQIALENQQVKSIDGVLVSMWQLRRKGYVSALQLEQEGAKKITSQRQIRTLLSQKLEVRQQIGKVRQQLAQLPLDLADRQDQVQQSLSQNRQQSARNALQQGAMLRAPAAGVVSTLLVKQGQAVAQQQAVLSVLPHGSTLQAQLLVPSRAIGFVRPGNQVVMRYQAFPYQKFGQQYGRVVNVSRSALSHDEVVSLLGQPAKQPLYRVQVKLSRQTIAADGQTDALKPGMALDASIMLDRRSLWQWAFEPLYGLHESLASQAPASPH